MAKYACYLVQAVFIISFFFQLRYVLLIGSLVPIILATRLYGLAKNYSVLLEVSLFLEPFNYMNVVRK